MDEDRPPERAWPPLENARHAYGSGGRLQGNVLVSRDPRFKAEALTGRVFCSHFGIYIFGHRIKRTSSSAMLSIPGRDKGTQSVLIGYKSIRIDSGCYTYAQHYTGIE
jgi:hypothetical protein